MTPVIVDAIRTPIARIDGELRDLSAQALAATLIGAAVERSGLDPARIDEVILASATEPQGNLARRAVLDAGLPADVPATTIVSSSSAVRSSDHSWPVATCSARSMGFVTRS